MKNEDGERILSASQINTYLACPRKWYYEYVEELPKEETFALVRGTVVHSVCEEFFDYKPPFGLPYREMVSQIRDRGNDLLDKLWSYHKVTKRFGDDQYNETVNMIDRFVLLHKWKMDATFEKTGDPSKAWNWNVPRFRELHILNRELGVQGYIDAVVDKGDDGIVLVDYKTSSIFKTPISEDYSRQMYIYALLYQRDTKSLPSYCELDFLRYGKSIAYPVRLEFLEEMENLIHTVHRKIKKEGKENYPANRAYRFCNWCDFKQTCANEP